MPKMRVMTFLKNPIGAVSNAIELSWLKERVKTLEARKKTLENELAHAAALEPVKERLEVMHAASRVCYDALTPILARLECLPRADARPVDYSAEDGRLCALLRDALAGARAGKNMQVEGNDDAVGASWDEEYESRVYALVEEYRERVLARRDASDESCLERLYRFVDAHLSELSKFQDELRRQTQLQYTRADEIKQVNREIREMEEKLSKVRQKQFG